MGRIGFAAACVLLTGVGCVRNIKGKSLTCGTKGSTDGSNVAIVNGEDAEKCEWSWQVGLQRSGSSSFFCGGMLIDKEWILTAAHCMGRSFNVVVGAYRMNNNSEASRQVRAGAIVISHPDYSSSITDYDFALVKLSSPIELGPCANTVCLPTDNAPLAAGTECWITGWGTLMSGGSQPQILQEAKVTVTSNDNCGNYATNQITPRMLCAQGLSSSGGITDACQGDSGGPLVCEVDGKWVLHGATSWGRGCAGADYPGIWARVTDQLEWIEWSMLNPPTPAPPTPAPVPTPGPPPCPDFSTGPDRDGDCKCVSGRCSQDGGATFSCPTSAEPGGWGGVYFLPTCTDCLCYTAPAPAPTPAAPTPAPARCPSFSSGPDLDGDCRCSVGKCSLDEGVSFNCPTSGSAGGWGGYYFLPSCEDCQCVSD